MWRRTGGNLKLWQRDARSKCAEPVRVPARLLALGVILKTPFGVELFQFHHLFADRPQGCNRGAVFQRVLFEEPAGKFGIFLDHAFEERAANPDDADRSNGVRTAGPSALGQERGLTYEGARANAVDFLEIVFALLQKDNGSTGDDKAAVSALILFEEALPVMIIHAFGAEGEQPELIVLEIRKHRYLSENGNVLGKAHAQDLR